MAVTSYTALPNSAVQAGGRPRGTTITALRDNPLAIAESDGTAPINQAGWHAYNKTTNGSTAAGRFYNFPTDGAVASFVTPDFEDNYEYMVIFDDLSFAVTGDLQMECFRDTDAAYNPAVALLATGGAANSVWGILECPFVQRAENHHFFTFRGVAIAALANSVATFTPVNVRNTMATSQRIRRLRFSISGGANTDSGSAFLYRRRLIL